jgi:hypothetical protein
MKTYCNYLLSSDEMFLMLQQKQGANYHLLYEMLVASFINTDGKFIKTVGKVTMPLTYKEIHSLLPFNYFNLDTVMVGIEFLKQIELIDKDEDGVMFIVGFNDLVGSEGESARRMRKHRKQLIIEQSASHCANIVATESRVQSLESRDKSPESKKDEKTKGLKDKMGATAPLISIDDLYDFEHDVGLLKTFSARHVFTKYLVKGGYLDKLDIMIPTFDDYFDSLINERNWDYYDIRPEVVRFVNKFKTRNEELPEIEKKYGYFRRAMESWLEHLCNEANGTNEKYKNIFNDIFNDKDTIE